MRRRGITLLEVTVSSSIFIVVLAMVSGMLSTTTSTTSLVNSVTTAQTEAERVVAFLRDELRGARTSDMLPSGVSGPETSREISYVVVDDSAPLFDATRPGSVPWAGERRILRFEADGDEVLDDGIDNDGDFLVDEGRLALYTSVGGVEQLLGVIATDLGSLDGSGGGQLWFTVDAVTQSLPVVSAEVHVERIMTEAIKGRADLDALAAGGGPRVSHTSRLFVTSLN